MNFKLSKGFTLIELLVVISIIGLLSSVVLASVNTARVKAKDANAKQLAREYRTLMELEISSTGTHTALNNAAVSGTGMDSWVTFAWCGNPSGAYGDKAEEICNALVNLKAPAPSTGYLYVSNVTTGIYRIIVGLSGSNRFFCLNGKGAANEYTLLADPDGAGPLSQWSYASAGACSDL